MTSAMAGSSSTTRTRPRTRPSVGTTRTVARPDPVAGHAQVRGVFGMRHAGGYRHVGQETAVDIALSKEERAFAERMRTFFTTEIPADIRDRLGRGEHATREDIVTSQRTMNAHGLAVPHWPVEWG